ncbi:precorrin-8X/cobalt-precorrin-8 methylmutase [Halalkaliarchaeum desulfuricum]|uniref:Precorrin-8X/cobalt-precorrin-8 methylmutase n=1 Tax=Halalkaliarchaeum desulfuricum TaxID=2055893 RepID=A0A343TNZ1_9EURY|nr:precorrin-8X methylmutase [Halalkaliarchaeum desulfuricum]AUX10813.1 precorrin-8X/cobalt-precorrin-8 methylmutase [Halalkaliarchaeum desulfuricum]
MTSQHSDEEYADLGATTQEAMEIAQTSLDIVGQFVPDETLADRFRRKSVHSSGDIEFQHLLRFGNDPAVAGARAVLDGRPIVTDISMAAAGITERGHDCTIRTTIGNGDELAEETGMTRSAAATLELDREGVYDGAIVTIGNAPTAALTLADCIEDGTRPAVVVATPVGFVKAPESRERIREVGTEYGVPTITNVGRRGGSGLAAALTNELIHVARDAREGEVDLDAAGTFEGSDDSSGDDADGRKDQ